MLVVAAILSGCSQDRRRQATLVVAFRSGGTTSPVTPLAAVGSEHSCRAWIVTPGELGWTKVVEHIRIDSREAKHALVEVRKLPETLSASVGASAVFDSTPAALAGFGAPSAWPCALA